MVYQIGSWPNIITGSGIENWRPWWWCRNTFYIPIGIKVVFTCQFTVTPSSCYVFFWIYIPSNL